LKSTTDKSKKDYLESTRHEVMEFQGTVLNYLIYMKTKKLGWKENYEIKNTGIKTTHGI
jgi:hypothetical protein